MAGADPAAPDPSIVVPVAGAHQHATPERAPLPAELGAEDPITVDALLGGRVRLVQPTRGYRVAIDPVLLAAAVAAEVGAEILDAGAGTGAVALCLSVRRPDLSIVGVELSPTFAALAARSVPMNGLEGRVTIVQGDLAEALTGRTFDHVVTNPPFSPARAYGQPQSAPAAPRQPLSAKAAQEQPQSNPPAYRQPLSARAVAHRETMPLAAWIAACLRRLRPGGGLTLVHRADRLPEIAAALLPAAGDLRILPLWPGPEARAARRVVVAARKGARGGAMMLRGLVLHDAQGHLTEAAQAILRDAAPLPLGR